MGPGTIFQIHESFVLRGGLTNQTPYASASEKGSTI